MEELAKIKSIKKNTQSRAYVTGLHSTPAGIEVTNLLLKYIQKTGNPALFILIVFPDIDRLLSLGSFAALKDAWPIMSKRLSRHLPSNSLCSQTQFGLLIQVWDAKAAQKLARTTLESLIDELNHPFRLSNSSRVSSFSLESYAGYMLLPGKTEASDNAESLLSKLATAAASTKHSKERLKCFSPSLQKLLTLQEYAISNLPQAIQEERLDLTFQPQFLAKNKSVCGAQTKLTWQDSRHGNITSNVFRNASALTGTLHEIVRFTIKHSAWFLKKLEGKGCLPPDFRLFVSTPFEIFHCHNFDFYTELENILSHSEVNFDNICIELEGNLELTSTQYTHALSCLKKIKNLGMTVCLNSDSNLTTLKFLSTGVIGYLKWNLGTANSLKAEEQAKILGSIMAIARYNHVGVVVGGIDLNNQLKLLRQNRVDIIQGALFAEPLSDSGFQNYLKYSSKLGEKTHSEEKTALLEKQC